MNPQWYTNGRANPHIRRYLANQAHYREMRGETTRS